MTGRPMGERYPVEWEADVLLRDGHPVHVRPISPSDGPALRDFHASLSSRSVYLRFFSVKPTLSDEEVRHFTTVDYVDRVAFVATDMGEIIGVGRYEAVGDGSAEVAFVIRDEVQGLGLGSILLENLAAAARERGITRFTAEVLPENMRMLATFRETGFEVHQRREEDVLAVSFAINPTDESVSVTYGRERRSDARSVQRLLSPRTVAVIGDDLLGHELVRNVRVGGFTGRLAVVHDTAADIDGIACVRSLAEIDEPIDLVLLAAPAATAMDVLARAGEWGVHGMVIVSGGFDGLDSGVTQADLTAAAREAGVRLVGPHALGLINTAPEVSLNASLVASMPLAGRVGFFCQSGALGAAVLERCRVRGVGLSTFVSAGNRVDVSGNDLLQYWQEDDDTDVALLYLETIGNARKFARVVRQMSRSKPVVMVRGGGVDAVHPAGHAVRRTRLSQSAVDQILADCGLIVVDDVEALLDAGRVLSDHRLPTSSAITVVSNSDALAALAANAVHAAGLSLAPCQVTLERTSSPEALHAAVHEARSDASTGAVVVIHVPAIEQPLAGHAIEPLAACDSCSIQGDVPVVAVLPRSTGVDDGGRVPVFDDVDRAVRALAAAAGLNRWRAEERSTRPADAVVDEESLVHVAHGRHAGVEASALLGSGGSLAIRATHEAVRGCRITLVEDPLYGSVVSVGLDDPVAEALDDRAYRVAPVTAAAARQMLSGLGAWQVLAAPLDEERVADLARLVRDVSRLPVRVAGASAADVRSAVAEGGGRVSVAEVDVIVSDAAATTDDAVRRM